MRSLNIAIFVQHHGIGTGASFNGRDEVKLATFYANYANELMTKSGHTVTVFNSVPDSYSSTWKKINANHKVKPYDFVYVCHLNSADPEGLVNHGLVFWDERSKTGPKYSPVVARHLADKLKIKVSAYPSNQPGYGRVKNCIIAATPVVMLLEPCFIQFDVNPVLIGEALSNAANEIAS